MALVLQVGSRKDFAKMPPNFPQCGDWMGSSESPKETIDDVRKLTKNLEQSNALMVSFYSNLICSAV
jgi:hypothetical protein